MLVEGVLFGDNLTFKLFPLFFLCYHVNFGNAAFQSRQWAWDWSI